MRPTPPRRGLVIGCGGTVGGAWTVGALVALEEALGWDARTAHTIVGTSAGATLAALLGAGVSVRQILAAQLDDPAAPPALRAYFTRPPRRWPPLPHPRWMAPGLALGRRAALTTAAGLAPLGRGDASFIDALIATLPQTHGWVAHPRTWIITLDVASGERVAFGAPDAPRATLAEAVRASWAIPGWFPPVTIGGRAYVDGGVASPSSADLLAPLGLDEVVVVAPMVSVDRVRGPGLAGRVEALMRAPMSVVADGEVAVLRGIGTRLIRLHPSAGELAVMGPNLMDERRRLAALEVSLRASRTALAQGGL